MSALTTALEDPQIRAAVAADGASLVEEEISGKRGLRAAALKAGFKTIKKIKPGIIPEAMSMLLPQFAPVIDPFYQKGLANGDVDTYFKHHRSEIADALLSVTDARAERAKQRVMKKVYFSLRGQAKTHTEAAVPKLSGLIKRHVQ